jgi:DNA adenine methylase
LPAIHGSTHIPLLSAGLYLCGKFGFDVGSFVFVSGCYSNSMSPQAKTSHGPSFLRWAGSKRKSLGHLAANIDLEGRRYIEPFAGSAALFFHFRPESGVLADQNAHLINALRMVRDFPNEVYDGMQSVDRDSDSYYRVRNTFNELAPDNVESASYFLYLNRNCFNGLWRTNKKGQFSNRTY